jgi:hypothetical protein
MRIVTLYLTREDIEGAGGGGTNCPLARALFRRYGRHMGVDYNGGIHLWPYYQKDQVGTFGRRGRRLLSQYDLFDMADPGPIKLYARAGFPDEPETKAAERLVKRLSKQRKTPRKKHGHVPVATAK